MFGLSVLIPHVYRHIIGKGGDALYVVCMKQKTLEET